MSGILQSVLFEKDKWTIQEAIRWLLDHDHKVKKIDITTYFARFRQISPESLRKKGYIEYRNKNIGHGIRLVIAYKPNQSSVLDIP